nr:hypothetical protein GCM10025732_07910 [Glycomyces mayteni]
MEPPYRQIAAELRAGIAAGDLRPGDRVPSVRQIAQRWGVATATANRVMAVLRDEGLVTTRVGAGTVVSDRAEPAPAPAPAPRVKPARKGSLPPPLTLARISAQAVEIADREGLQAVTMRRVAADLHVGPMSLYRHVATKEDLLLAMIAAIAAERPLPGPRPTGAAAWSGSPASNGTSTAATCGPPASSPSPGPCSSRPSPPTPSGPSAPSTASASRPAPAPARPSPSTPSSTRPPSPSPPSPRPNWRPA